MSYNIYIFYRHYDTENAAGRNLPSHPRNPDWLDYEACFINFVETINSYKNIKLHVLMDDHGERNNFIYKYGDCCENIHRFDARSYIGMKTIPNDILDKTVSKQDKDKRFKIYSREGGSYLETCKYIQSQKYINQDDIIFLVENDYLHVNGWVEKICDLLDVYPEVTQNNYITTVESQRKYYAGWYNELIYMPSEDKVWNGFRPTIYNTGARGYQEHIKNKKLAPVGREHHWITSITTSSTFMTSKHIFDADYDVHTTVMNDGLRWPWLFKYRKRYILEPIPTLATHCMNTCMCKGGSDWESISKQSKSKQLKL